MNLPNVSQQGGCWNIIYWVGHMHVSNRISGEGFSRGFQILRDFYFIGELVCWRMDLAIFSDEMLLRLRCFR